MDTRLINYLCGGQEEDEPDNDGANEPRDEPRHVTRMQT